MKYTNAQRVSLAKFYFVNKKKEFALNDEIFEEEFYEDVAKQIDLYCNYGQEIAIEPDFELVLKRYIKYQYRTIHYKAFSAFLNSDYYTDKLVLLSSVAFVKNNYKNFIYLKEIERVNGKDKILDCLKIAFIDNGFSMIVSGFLKYENGNEVSEPELKEMFLNGIVPKKLLKQCRDFWKDKGEIPACITTENAGYYYALSKGMDKEKAKDYVKNKDTILPIAIDIYGSCITNTIINQRITYKSSIVRNNYFFHTPIYESCRLPVQYPDNTFSEELDLKENLVKMQFDHSLFENIMSSKADWCLLDLYSLIAPRTYKYNDLIYTDVSGKPSQILNVERIDIVEEHELLGSWDEIREKVKVVLSWLKQRWNNHIIFVDMNISELQLGDDNTLYRVRETQRCSKIRDIINNVRSLINEEDYYIVSITNNFLPSDIGYISRGLVHYEFDFYDEAINIIKYIVDNEPIQKVYKKYSNECRVRRIVRYYDNDKVLLKTLFSSVLDEIIMQIPKALIKKHFDSIVGWYNQGITSKQDLLKIIREKDELKELESYIINSEPILGSYDEAIKNLPTAYKGYDERDDKRLRPIAKKKYYISYFDENEIMKKSIVEYGTKTKLRKIDNKDNRSFIGWTAHRVSDDKYCYTNGTVRKFFTKGEEDEGFTLYYYPDRAVVAKQSKVLDDTIEMTAHWE